MRLLRWLANFVDERMPQSSARAIAIAAGLTACLCAFGAVGFAFKHPTNWQTAAALGGTTVTSLAGLVGYALKVRKRTPDGPADDAGDAVR